MSERKLFDTVPIAYEIVRVAKTMIDGKITFFALKLLGCLLMHLKNQEQALLIFNTMRDIGYEFLNWSFVITSFDLIGRSKQKDQQYKDSMISYKNMLQLAWFCDSSEYEVRAYMGMAR